MATYELVNADQLDSDLTAVGNAIRSKGGTSAKLSFPSGMVSAIDAISTGVELNFDVVPGLTQPSTVSENAIWVKTEKIGAWYFSGTQPEGMQEWDVWFPTGTSSPDEFNALKKNGIQVYPTSAKQYVSGALVGKTAKIYRNGEWVTLWNGELYDSGNQYEHATGGWKYVDDDGYKGRTKFNSANISINNKSSYETDTIYTNNMMDLTGFSKITAVVEVSGANIGVYVGIASRNNDHRAYANCSLAHKKTTKSGTITCDIPSTVNSGYPYVCADEANVTITKIYLE